jgi:hypothetical protein
MMRTHPRLLQMSLELHLLSATSNHTATELNPRAINPRLVRALLEDPTVHSVLEIPLKVTIAIRGMNTWI